MLSKIVDAGMDYLTLTTREPSRYSEWREAFAFVASVEQAKGHKWAVTRVLGYDGEQCGHAFVGKREDGAMLRLSSAAAQEWGSLFAPEACHCTRIDLQATVEFAAPDQHMLERAYDTAQGKKMKNGRPPLFTFIENSEGGSTLYVGSRSSMRYGRIYDKGVEQGTLVPGKLYRWELEIKDALADQAVAMLCGNAQFDRVLMGLLGDFFKERQLPVPWSIPSLEEAFIVPRVAVDDAGGLRWLAGPVATTFARLMDTVGAESTLRAIFAKCLTESTDSAIISTMAQMYTEHIANVR